MPANLVMPSVDDFLRFLPETILTVVGTLLMVLDPLFGKTNRKLFGHISIAGLIAAALANFAVIEGPAYSNLLTVDGFAIFFRMLFLAIGILAVLSSYMYLDREKADTAEYHGLILFSIVGQCVMVAANDLMMVFIGLEISSIASYVLAGYLRDDKRNNESALKYFLLGSFATGFLLYGIALIYGVTATTKLDGIRSSLASGAANDSMIIVTAAAALMLVGLAFKVSGAPFQIWAPDVYQGAPAPVSGFMATAPKAAAFAIFFRIFLTAFPSIANDWQPLVWISALFSMTIGNFAALAQTNLKRMLAYSSIAHAGYLLVALTAKSETGTAAAMFYLAAYSLMNLGVFAVVIHISGKGETHTGIEALKGLGSREPVTAGLLTVFLLSLVGVPLTGGFFGKFYIFRAALESNLIWLTVLGLLNSAVAAYYYLRLLVMMYFHEPEAGQPDPGPLAPGLRLAMILSAAGTFVLGITPGAILEFAQKSTTFVK